MPHALPRVSQSCPSAEGAPINRFPIDNGDEYIGVIFEGPGISLLTCLFTFMTYPQEEITYEIEQILLKIYIGEKLQCRYKYT